MFYLKTDIDGEIRNIEIYNDEIYTECFICNREFQPDPDAMRFVYQNDGDLSSTRLSCGCSTERPKLIRIK